MYNLCSAPPPPPPEGGAVSQSQANKPLRPLPHGLDPFPEPPPNNHQGPAGFNRTWVRRTYRLGGLIGSADLRPAESPV